jgi:hypothetical protein
MKDMNDIVEEMKARIYFLAANMVAIVEFWCVVYVPAITTIVLPWM